MKRGFIESEPQRVGIVRAYRNEMGITFYRNLGKGHWQKVSNTYERESYDVPMYSVLEAIVGIDDE